MPAKPTKSIPTDNPINTEDKDKNLNVAIDEIIKEHGKGSIMRLCLLYTSDAADE